MLTAISSQDTKHYASNSQRDAEQIDNDTNTKMNSGTSAERWMVMSPRDSSLYLPSVYAFFKTWFQGKLAGQDFKIPAYDNPDREPTDSRANRQFLRALGSFIERTVIKGERNGRNADLVKTLIPMALTIDADARAAAGGFAKALLQTIPRSKEEGQRIYDFLKGLYFSIEQDFRITKGSDDLGLLPMAQALPEPLGSAAQDFVQVFAAEHPLPDVPETLSNQGFGENELRGPDGRQAYVAGANSYFNDPMQSEGKPEAAPSGQSSLNVTDLGSADQAALRYAPNPNLLTKAAPINHPNGQPTSGYIVKRIRPEGAEHFAVSAEQGFTLKVWENGIYSQADDSILNPEYAAVDVWNAQEQKWYRLAGAAGKQPAFANSDNGIDPKSVEAGGDEYRSADQGLPRGNYTHVRVVSLGESFDLQAVYAWPTT